ncbi:MAG: endonuclease/exonuclease/phosphatase (EEP) superfamily protein YafD [Saprospiraceae bacterium]|jgi:endonuclease/exonuclease/phosphatase (EEP) superfamily protein YafD
MQTLLKNNIINTALYAILIAGAALVIFSPDFLIIKWGANYAVRILFTYLFLGFLFLIVDQKRLMMISLFSAGALAIFLKTMTNSEMAPPIKTKDEPIIKIAHFNINNSNEGFQATLATIQSTEADLISITETNPLWDSLLVDKLNTDYPFHFSNPSLGLFGMTLFSKSPFTYIDTIRYQEIPNIIGGIILDEDNTVNFICSHTLPALNYRYYNRLKEHLDKISEYCNQTTRPILTFGDYHSVPWSNEIAEFRNKTNLSDSRRGFTPTFPHGSSTVFEVPIDHIFFSEELKCLSFSTISSLYTTHMGIQGTFQLKPQISENATKEN